MFFYWLEGDVPLGLLMDIHKLVFWLQKDPLKEPLSFKFFEVKIQPGEICQYYEKTSSLKIGLL